MSHDLALNLNKSLIASEQSIDYYIAQVKSFPTLSKEAEQELAHAFIQQGDRDAARNLVMSHLRFVLYIARGYRGYGLPLADLVQEGNVGLMKAVKRFDPTMGVRLVSFAVHWIRAEIHEFILRNWRIVKVATTKAQRKLFFNLRSSKKRLGWLSHSQVQQVAEDLGVTPKDVLEMEKRLSVSDPVFDGPSDQESEDFVASPASYLEDNRFNPAELLEQHDWEQQRQIQLKQGVSTLDDRSQDILQQRWLGEEKATLQTLADKYQISAERVRQIENNAMKKLKKQINIT
ncbi:RNA polymerase sigma factor RpoH [Candidatus Venteria ishoeyi]|uniref:RNA polymerase sigma factor RpoH n=1 Tax=Candidatus Venteria ishoeyi TaxID=1899563 RepID=A0A1H6F684_9GAMM|nr:RNA polymerase sigma factor RpoH [Candidatus Venteria ishoeyi]MDM8548090.1 RNA polymerase sigma factor RpoH [Candidatus Venteria ishoeyi]SEH05688.1 RNA polymerase sigma factor RpoH [Candidatus Venteria ishoeyi]